MEQLHAEHAVLKKKSKKTTMIILLGIVAILFFNYYWYLPLVGEMTGAVVFWILITTVITVTLIVLWNSTYEASAEEKDRLDTIARVKERHKQIQNTKSKKIKIAINDVISHDSVRWETILYIVRYYTPSQGNLDVSKISPILPFVHLAELKRFIFKEDALEIYWSSSDLCTALGLLEKIAQHHIKTSNQNGLNKLVEQVRMFLEYCKKYRGLKGYEQIVQETQQHTPILYQLASKKKY